MSANAKKRVGIKNPNYKFKEYVFKNIISNKIFKGTQNAFGKIYNIHNSSVSSLISGKYKSSQNWIIVNN